MLNNNTNIALYTYYATFKSEAQFREVFDNMDPDERDYYFPTFDHYLDAINFSNGEYIGSSYIPDNIMELINAEQTQQNNATTLTNALLAKVMSM